MSDTRSAAARVITDRRFGPYVVGNLTSNVGNWFQNVAAGIVVFQLSNAPVGVVSGALLRYRLWRHGTHGDKMSLWTA